MMAQSDYAGVWERDVEVNVDTEAKPVVVPHDDTVEYCWC
jgi:hypothetical protein